MLKKNIESVPKDKVEMQGAKGLQVQWLFSPKDGVPNFSFRIFHIEESGTTPQHTHAWEHEVLFLEGEGEVFVNNQLYPFKAGDAFFIPGGEEHQIRAKSKGKFICLIPNSGC